MGANSAISWCDNTVNFWIGCTKVSTAAAGGGACDFCYAERDFDLRKHVAKWGAGQPRHRTKTWQEPFKWNNRAATFREQHGHWPRVFANSLSDIFDNEVPISWQIDALQVISHTRNLRWMLTTKRAVNIRKIVAPEFFRANPHVGVIISICNQMEANRDVPRLLALKAELGIAWIGLSCEPLLGPIDLTNLCWKDGDADIRMDVTNGEAWVENSDSAAAYTNEADGNPKIDWVICGGESGPHARPMHPDWPRSLRDQCAAAAVPFHFKQWGEWCPRNHFAWKPGEDVSGNVRVGKARAGRLLDGIEHNGFPEALQ